MNFAQAFRRASVAMVDMVAFPKNGIEFFRDPAMCLPRGFSRIACFAVRHFAGKA